MSGGRKNTSGRLKGLGAVLALAFLLATAPVEKARAQLPVPPVPVQPEDCVTCDQIITQIDDFILPITTIYTMLTAIDVIEMPTIIGALYGFPVVPGAPPGIDTDLNNGFQQINKDLSIMAGQVFPTVSQMDADSYKTYGDYQGQAEQSADAIVSEKSTKCAMTQAQQLRAALDGALSSLTRGFMQVILRRNSLAAAASGINIKTQRVCEIAPFIAQSPRLQPNEAATAAKCTQTDAGNGASPLPTYLIDGHLDEGNVFNKLQFSLPTGVKTSPNGHIQFTPQNDSEWEFVAAWRYCEKFLPDAPGPPSVLANGTPSLDDIKKMIVDQRETVGQQMTAIDHCMQGIAYRTACPHGTENDFAGPNPGDCWQLQDNLCHRLTNSAPSGLGITATGDADADYALANCDDDGLSEAMADYVLAHRCGDANYTMVSAASDAADASQAGDVHKSCETKILKFEKRIDDAKAAFHKARNAFSSN